MSFDHIRCTEPDYLGPLGDVVLPAPVDWKIPRACAGCGLRAGP